MLAGSTYTFFMRVDMGTVPNGTLVPDTVYVFTLVAAKACAACQHADTRTGSRERDAEGRCPPAPELPGIPTVPIDETCLLPARNGTAEIAVTVLAGSPPVVTVKPMPQAKMPSSEMIPLYGSVSGGGGSGNGNRGGGGGGGAVTLLWTQTAGDLDMSSLNTEGGLFTHPKFVVPLNLPEIAIKPSTLTPGSEYTFMLTATDQVGGGHAPRATRHAQTVCGSVWQFVTVCDSVHLRLLSTQGLS